MQSEILWDVGISKVGRPMIFQDPVSESSTKFVEHALFISLLFFFFFSLRFYLPEGINYAKKLNPTAAENTGFSPLLGFWCCFCTSFKRDREIHRNRQMCWTVWRQHADMHPARCRREHVLIFVTASIQCGFCKHMTSMITSMGALNRFKFCACVARQQHNRSPSLPSLYGSLLGLLWCYHWKWLINFNKKSINGVD